MWQFVPPTAAAKIDQTPLLPPISTNVEPGSKPSIQSIHTRLGAQKELRCEPVGPLLQAETNRGFVENLAAVLMIRCETPVDLMKSLKKNAVQKVG